MLVSLLLMGIMYRREKVRGIWLLSALVVNGSVGDMCIDLWAWIFECKILCDRGICEPKN